MVRPDSETYRRGVRRALLVTLALNVAVVAGKLIAGLIAGSLSVISDAIHSSVDSLNNIVRLAVKVHHRGARRKSPLR
jgi:divalent metal cation (Fe/Co/Zn/Cd) transporter